MPIKRIPLTLQQQMNLIDKSVMEDVSDDNEEEDTQDLHDLEMSKVFEKVTNGTIDDIKYESDESILDGIKFLLQEP
uniref:Uncharacterized protein n=1 Tax=Panagrolaimus superbus TaxID=310955 RepID=A0A914XTR7_9BILA